MIGRYTVQANVHTHGRSTFLILCCLLSLCLFVLSACGTGPTQEPTALQSSTPQAQSTGQTQSAITQTATTTDTSNVKTGTTASKVDPAKKGYPVKVFFSKKPDSDNNFLLVFPVNRVSPTNNVATYAIQSLVAGPTAGEKTAGYFTELLSMLKDPVGTPECAGKDFTITLDTKGSTPEKGTATLKFCRSISSPGVGADATTHAQIEQTLLQFSTIKKVIILDAEGKCFGDMSGLNVCLTR